LFCRYFVFGRVAEAIKYTAEEYYCKGTLAQKIKKILVVSDSEKTLRYKDGVLIVLVDLSLGSFGTIDGEKMKREILRGKKNILMNNQKQFLIWQVMD
jgi:hypothetical protein